jgi:2-polyprenyl-6-methoxyphenol hydroxylase-like FAD-dependent oxidoreductase
MPRSVLISGAGIAGPTLAYWLHRHGFEPTIVERAPAPRTGGYMIDFWGIGYDVAERMGLLPRLYEDGYLLGEVRFVGDDGRRIGGFDASTFRSATNKRFVSVQRGDLAHSIWQLVEPDVETVFGDSIAALHEDADGVTVTFEHARARRFGMVIGADGLHSNVRTLAFGDGTRFEHFLGYYTAAFTARGYPHRDEDVYVGYTVPGRQIARYALREGRSAFFFVLTQDAPLAIHHDDADAQRRLLRERFSGIGWEADEILAALESADDFYFDAVSQTRMSDWSRGRVALVGDAAYCPSLLAGEGSGLGMAGAYLLAWALRESSGDHAAAFGEYQRRFKPFVDAKQKSATRFGSWFAPRTKLGVRLRNGLTTAFMRMPLVSDFMVKRAVDDEFALPD